MNSQLTTLLNDGFALRRPNTLIYLLRHANAESPKGFADADREISEKGKRQCQAIKIRIGGIAFSRKYRSPLKRVGQTLEEVGINGQDVTQLPKLFVGAGSESRRSGVLDTAYQILGNVGLAEIMKYSEVANAMNEFASEALATLHREWRSIPNWDDGGNAPIDIFIAGHGWFNPILAYYLTQDNSAREHLLNNSMGEAEIFVVGLNPEWASIWESIPCPVV